MKRSESSRRAPAAAVPVPFWVRALMLVLALAIPTGIPSGALGGISTWVPTFTLWDAARDLQAHPGFGDGGTIPDAVRQCAAIEIIPPGNEALPGSVRVQLDGAGGGCGNGTPFDNVAPYGFDTDGGGTHEYSCSQALSVVGPHTLAVTPYAGKSCSGPRGTTTTIKFTVEGPAGPVAPKITWINGELLKISCGTLDGTPVQALMSVQVETSPGGWAFLPILTRAMVAASTEVLVVGLPPTGDGLFPTRCLHGNVPGEPETFYFHAPCD